MMPLLAVISGSQIVTLLITILVVAVIFGLIEWAIKAIPVGEPWAKVMRVIIIIATVVVLANALLTLVGKPFISW